jgi:hypothetical protein
MIEVYERILRQQLHMLNHIKAGVWGSGNMNGIPQWRDRKRLHDLIQKVKEDGYLLTKKDFQFLESLVLKYKF